MSNDFIARVVQVIERTFERRGKGIEGDTTRRVRQYWTLEGELLAEIDPNNRGCPVCVDANLEPSLPYACYVHSVRRIQELERALAAARATPSAPPPVWLANLEDDLAHIVARLQTAHDWHQIDADRCESLQRVVEDIRPYLAASREAQNRRATHDALEGATATARTLRHQFQTLPDSVDRETLQLLADRVLTELTRQLANTFAVS